ncbi:hypothetical protein LSAT2_027457 [Lamellibrachia satsuma]|nr:hypothetical protein LSAT2_027457 [Lamellibrachia satsuma]
MEFHRVRVTCLLVAGMLVMQVVSEGEAALPPLPSSKEQLCTACARYLPVTSSVCTTERLAEMACAEVLRKASAFEVSRMPWKK